MAKDRGSMLSLMPGDGSTRRAELNNDAFAKMFAVLDLIADWCSERSNRISGCYLEHAPDGLALYLVGSSQVFDFELNRELADLTATLVSKSVPIYSTLVPASAPVHANGFKDGHMIYRVA